MERSIRRRYSGGDQRCFTPTPRPADLPFDTYLTSTQTSRLLALIPSFITPVPQDLRGLPASDHIQIRILISSKSLHHGATASDLRLTCTPTRSTKSSDTRLHTILSTKLSTVGAGSFGAKVARAWEHTLSVPLRLRNSKIKTHVYTDFTFPHAST